MSGGSYNYTYSRLLQLYIKDRNKSPIRNIIQTLTFLMADVLHDVEWVDSGDYGEDDQEVRERLEKLLKFAGEVASVPKGHLSLEMAREYQAEYLDTMRLDELAARSDDEPDSF